MEFLRYLRVLVNKFLRLMSLMPIIFSVLHTAILIKFLIASTVVASSCNKFQNQLINWQLLGRSSGSAPPLPGEPQPHGKLGEPPCYPMVPPPLQYPHHSSPEVDARSPGSPRTPSSPAGPDDLSIPKRVEIDVVNNNNNNEGEGSISRIEGSG